MNRRNFIITASATLAGLSMLRKADGASSPWMENDFHSEMPLLLGTDYYPDQTAEQLWERDAGEMAAMGITNVRVAEFAWGLMEPREGSFDFAWLRRSVDLLHNHGLAVILGTPSAAPPPWLTQLYPEVLMVNEHGLTLSPGTRRFTCPTNKRYRQLSLAIATEMARAFQTAPGVIGWQIDNELTLGESGRCYCHSCREGFQQWAMQKYGSIEAINQAWGAVFWSNTYTDATQIPVPLPSGAPPNPGFALDYDRYQSFANVSFQKEQLVMLRQVCPKHFVTTNNVTLADTIDSRDLYSDLDFVASDNYPGFTSIYMSNPSSGVSIPTEALASVIAMSLDFSRSAKDGKPFLIMEQQTGKAGQTIMAPQPEPGQLRLWTYQAVAHGAMGINYFRWDTATSGAEEYWHGLLRHDRSKSPGFAEIQKTIEELKQLGRSALEAPYAAEVALCFDYDSDWAMAIQPGQPQLKYMTEAISWYSATAASHAGIDVVDGKGDLSRYKFVLAPTLYVVSAKQAEAIRSYVRGGGTFVAGFRLGVKDEDSRIVETPLPGLLRDVMGVELIDYQPIFSDKQGVKFQGMLAGPDAECRVWSDILDPKGAEVLATYTTAMHAGKAAITSHSFGKGKAVYLGAHLEPADLARVLLTLMAAGGLQSSWKLPQGFEICTRGTGTTTWTYVLNHTPQPQTVQMRGNYRDRLTNTSHADTVTLEPYGVRVLTPA
jgi:beta-galactosidase